MSIQLDFLSIDQSLSYLSKYLGVLIKKRELLSFCIEHKIKVKYKALTTFYVMKQIEITEYEFIQLQKHKYFIDYTNIDKNIVDNTIFKGLNEDLSVKSQMYKINERYKKDYKLINEHSRLIAIANFKELMFKDDKYYIFSEDSQEKLPSGIYEFWGITDSQIGDLNLGIHNFENEDNSYYPSNNQSYLTIEGTFYLLNNINSSNDENSAIISAPVFQQGFLKIDIDYLIKKLLNNGNDEIKSNTLHPRTANNASKIISALCELNRLDITQPYGRVNKEIMGVLDQLGAPLSKDVIGEWLKLAHENTK